MTTGQIEGYCRSCDRIHRLENGNTVKIASQLIKKLECDATIDLFSDNKSHDERFSTSHLLGDARGKMFGVLEVLTTSGKPDFLYAFSGQYNSQWQVDGWVPPIFDVDDFTRLTSETEKEIKALTKQISNIPRMEDEWLQLRKQRRLLSRKLMQEIEQLYKFINFRGEKCSLEETFTGSGGIPTGTGDCCAPKLLHFAAKNKLHPVGLCEFFWGRQTKSRSYRHGELSTPCVEKCQPILGFLLCGLDELALG